MEVDERTDDDVLCAAQDLTTHAVIIDMTGAGKTGLGIDILEEAAMDNIRDCSECCGKVKTPHHSQFTDQVH